MGNHTYGQREIYDFIDDAKRMIRPANFPVKRQVLVCVLFRLMILKLPSGRSFMQDIDDPFKKQSID